MTIYIGADHNGYELKERLEEALKAEGYNVADTGNQKLDPGDDYPIMAARLVNQVLADTGDSKGVLICGSGQGMAIAANRYHGIRAAVVHDSQEAVLSKVDDDTNVLALAAYEIGLDTQIALNIVKAWLDAEFDTSPRRVRRLEEIESLAKERHGLNH